MNRLLADYCVAVLYPEVSGAEHLELLQSRDRLAALAASFTVEEQAALEKADATLAAHASLVHHELQRFLDLAAYRREQSIPPERWWWYLDVLQYAPRQVAATAVGA